MKTFHEELEAKTQQRRNKMKSPVIRDKVKIIAIVDHPLPQDINPIRIESRLNEREDN